MSKMLSTDTEFVSHMSKYTVKLNLQKILHYSIIYSSEFRSSSSECPPSFPFSFVSCLYKHIILICAVLHLDKTSAHCKGGRKLLDHLQQDGETNVIVSVSGAEPCSRSKFILGCGFPCVVGLDKHSVSKACAGLSPKHCR